MQTMKMDDFPTYEYGEFYQSLSPAAQADLDLMVVPFDYPAKTVLFSESDLASEIFIVMEGQVRLSIAAVDGRRLGFRIAKAGEVLGLSSVILGQTHDTSAETVGSAVVAHLSRELFVLFLNSHPGAYQPIARELIRTYGGSLLRPTNSETARSQSFALQLANA